MTGGRLVASGSVVRERVVLTPVGVALVQDVGEDVVVDVLDVDEPVEVGVGAGQVECAPEGEVPGPQLDRGQAERDAGGVERGVEHVQRPLVSSRTLVATSCSVRFSSWDRTRSASNASSSVSPLVPMRMP